MENCKSFGTKGGFKKCGKCEAGIKTECEKTYLASIKPEIIQFEYKKDEVKPEENKPENATPEENTPAIETVVGTAKIGKADQIKNMIFGLAKKAQFTRKELGEKLRKAFPEYKKSTLSTYISDSFNVKYAGATGCGEHRMLSYTKVGTKKIVTVR